MTPAPSRAGAARITICCSSPTATASRADDGALEVTGLDCVAVGDLAGRHGVYLHELSLNEPSLETAYMELTHDAVDYRSPAALA